MKNRKIDRDRGSWAWNPREIKEAVSEMARQMTQHFDEMMMVGEVVNVVVILKGGATFAADLMREIRVPMAVTYVTARTFEFEDGREPHVALVWPPPPEDVMAAIANGGRTLVIDAICDTGRTLKAAVTELKGLGDGSAVVQSAVCLHRYAGHGVQEYPPTFAAFTLEPGDGRQFIGYGMGDGETWRDLPWIEGHDG